VTAIAHAKLDMQRLHSQLVEETRGESAGLFRPYSLATDPALLVQVYPHDRNLPALPSLAAGAATDVNSAIAAECGMRSLDAAGLRVELARYRPLQGATLRYRTDARSDRTLYVKAYRDRAGHDALATLERLRAASGHRAGFEVVRPVAHVESCSALVVDRAPGTPVTELIDIDAEFAGRVTARSLAAFHAADLPCPRTWTRNDSLKRVHQAQALIVTACPELEDDVARVRAALSAAPFDHATAPAQLDPKPDHVLVDGERVTFIDLDTFAAADPIFDAAFMYARIRALGETRNASRPAAHRAADVFLESYLAQARPEARARFAINHAYALLQLTLYAVRHHDDGWRELATRRIGAAVEACAKPRS
jgi:hypothetical protein